MKVVEFTVWACVDEPEADPLVDLLFDAVDETVCPGSSEGAHECQLDWTASASIRDAREDEL